MKQYPKMKNSGVAWLGEVPEHWVKKSLIQFAEEQQMKNVGLRENNLLSLSYGKIINKDINATDGLLPASFEGYQIVYNGNIILRLTDLQNDHRSLRTGLVTQTGIITSAYTCLKVRGGILPEYLHLELHVADLRKVFYGMGGGVRQSIGFKDIRSLVIVVPPFEEQDQIVRFLDWKVSGINRLINLRKKQIAALEELKKSVISKAVTKGLDPNAKMKDSGVAWLGEVPEHWVKKSLIQFAEEQQMKNVGLRENNLLSLSYGKIINKDINATDGLLPASFEGYQIVYNGNIILRLTDLQNDHRSLRTGLVTQTGIITSAYTCLKVRGGILPEYLHLELHVADLRKVFYGMGGGVRQGIGFKDIRSLVIVVPPLPEQDRIVDYLDTQTAKINTAIEKKKQQIELLQEFKTRLISDVVTGKIDVRGVEIPEYEVTGEEPYAVIDEENEEESEEQED